MLKKTVSYVDYNGEPQTEDFYFHLNKAELIKMETNDKSGSFLTRLQEIIKAPTAKDAFELIEELAMKAYGIKSPDGKRFIKTEEVREEFMQTEAYSEFFMSLVADANLAAEFLNGLLPADLLAQAEEQMRTGVDPTHVRVGVPPQPSVKTSEQIRQESMAQMQGFKKPVEPSRDIPIVESEPVTATPIDISNLSPEQQQDLLRQLQQ